MELIDKSALAAEIEKCYNECLKKAKITDSGYWNAKADAYRNVWVILNDTLEVKEVDLNIEEELKKYGISSPKTRDVCIASHFYELGFKAQKGE